MAKIIVENYTFDASEKKVTFTDYNPIVIERVLLIVNVVDNVIIYNFNDNTLGGTAATNVLTLTYDTTSMSDTDQLMIFYDHAAYTQPVSGTMTGVTTVGTITNVVHVDDNSSTLSIDDGAGSLTVDGTVAVTNADITSIKTAVEILDNIVAGTEAQVDVITLPVGHNIIDSGTVTAVTSITNPVSVTGTFWQATQPVSLATVPSHEVTNAGTFAVQADTELTTADVDTGAGTDTRAVVGLVGTASGGGQLIPGSSTDGLLVNLGANNDVTITSGTVTAVTSITNPVAVTGTFYQATQPVSLASVPSHAVTNAGTFAVQVDGDALTSLQLIDNAISGAGFNITQLAGAAVPIGAGTEAAALRVTVATDSTGVLSVDDNGGALTVDGTVTANLSATDNTVLDNIDTAVTSKYITGIGHGVKTVTTAGTDVAIAASTPCKRVTIQAQTDNTNLIAVGGSGVDATIATGTGVVLYPGDVFELDIDNLADVYIDSLVNGEGCRFTYFT